MCICAVNYYNRNETNRLLTGYAKSVHTHNDYAPTAHTHNYADPDHTHNYADPDHTHNDYAPTAHTHNYADPAHTHNYADPAHTHADYAATSHTHNYADPAHTHADYAASSHTHNYADPAHTHDDRYYTESEVTTQLAGKAAASHSHTEYSQASHSHDDRYYTESEVTTQLAGKAATSHTHTEYSQASHSHDDRYYTETEINTILKRIIGEITMWATDTPPSGWLLCAGQEVSRSTYLQLYAVIGTRFGAGNGATTFNLPDFRGRFPLGQDDMNGSSANRVTAASADSIGGNGGAETHTLSISEMPSHGSHHYYNETGYTHSGGTGFWNFGASGAVGGGSPHNNMPPYLTLNFIIFAGV